MGDKGATGEVPVDTVDFGSMLDRDIWGYFPVKLVPGITGLAAIVILTRNLEPEEYGTYSVVIATVLLIVQMFGTWLSNAVLYVYPDYQNKNDRAFLHHTFKLQGIAASVAVLFGYTAILLITHNHLLGLIGALIIVAQLFQSLMTTFLQSTRRVGGQAVSVIVQSLAQLGVLCGLIYLVKGKEEAALSAVLAGYISCIPVLLFQTFALSRKKLTGNDLAVGHLFGKLLSYGMPMCMWFFATQFYTIGDRILLKLIGSTTGLGEYASFRDLATGGAGFLTMPILMASHPIIMAMWKRGIERSLIEQLMTRNLVILTILFVPIFVAVDLCGPELIMGLLGGKYLLPKPTMLLVVGSIFLGSVTMYVQKGLEVTGRTLQMSKLALVAAIISLFGNVVLIPNYGVRGAAMMVVVVQLLYLTFVWYATKGTLRATIPIRFVGKLALWAIGVELVCRLLEGVSGPLGSFLGSRFVRVIVLVGATCALYAANDRVSSVGKAIIRAFKRAKQ